MLINMKNIFRLKFFLNSFCLKIKFYGCYRKLKVKVVIVYCEYLYLIGFYK